MSTTRISTSVASENYQMLIKERQRDDPSQVWDIEDDLYVNFTQDINHTSGGGSNFSTPTLRNSTDHWTAMNSMQAVTDHAPLTDPGSQRKRFRCWGRTGTHSWTVHERRSLCILKRFTMNSFSDIAAVLNKLSASNSSAKISESAAQATWCSMSKTKGKYSHRVYAIYKEVCIDHNLEGGKRFFHGDLQALSDLAISIGITLHPRESNIAAHVSRVNSQHNQALYERAATGSSGNADTAFTNSYPVEIVDMTEDSSARATLLDGYPATGGSRNSHSTAMTASPIFFRQAARTVSLTSPKRIDFSLTAVTSALPVNHAEHNLAIADVPPRLFRTYSAKSAGKNGWDGFRAGFYSISRTPIPIGHPSGIDSPDFRRHLVHHVERRITATPFVSTTSSLVWAIHSALKPNKQETAVAIISGRHVAQRQNIYHLHPLLQMLKGNNETPLKSYHGYQEYLVWGEIRGEAIINTISGREIRQLCVDAPSVRDFLRLDILEQSKSVADLQTQFRSVPVGLDELSGLTIGKLLRLLHFSPTDPPEVLTQIIYEVLQGWQIVIPRGNTHQIEKAKEYFIENFALGLQVFSEVKDKILSCFHRAVEKAKSQHPRRD